MELVASRASDRGDKNCPDLFICYRSETHSLFTEVAFLFMKTLLVYNDSFPLLFRAASHATAKMLVSTASMCHPQSVGRTFVDKPKLFYSRDFL